MPERVISLIDQVLHTLIFFFIGVLIAAGHLLSNSERTTMKLVIGRMITTGGLAMAAGSVLIFTPELPLVGQIGIAAALASLGTAALERVFQGIIDKRLS